MLSINILKKGCTLIDNIADKSVKQEVLYLIYQHLTDKEPTAQNPYSQEVFTQILPYLKKKGQNKSAKNTDKFIPPTLGEVEAYIQDMGYCINGLKFHTYYSAKKWKSGRYKITDWKRAVDFWQSNHLKYLSKQGQNTTENTCQTTNKQAIISTDNTYTSPKVGRQTLDTIILNAQDW